MKNLMQDHQSTRQNPIIFNKSPSVYTSINLYTELFYQHRPIIPYYLPRPSKTKATKKVSQSSKKDMIC